MTECSIKNRFGLYKKSSLDQFSVVWLPVSMNLESGQLGAVMVHQNLAEKPDQTRFLNTNLNWKMSLFSGWMFTSDCELFL